MREAFIMENILSVLLSKPSFDFIYVLKYKAPFKLLNVFIIFHKHTPN